MQYRAIAERLAMEIMKGRKPGERLPGVRELAKQERVSLVTAHNVYRVLKEKGLITVRQGSGTFVRALGEGGLVDMAAIGPPDEMLLWLGRYLNLSLEGLTEYDPPEGYGPLREKAREWLAWSGIDSLPVVTSGSQQALFLAGLALLRPGDLVAVESPCYQGAVRTFESLKAKVKPIPYLTSQDTLKALADEPIKLLYIMPQGHFPTGLSIPEKVRSELITLSEEKGFFIMEDDPVSDLVGIPPLKSMDRFSRVIYTKSLSNILGPGLRIGFSVFPECMREAVMSFKEISDLSISSMVQRMVVGLMESTDFSAHLRKLKKLLEDRVRISGETFGLPAKGTCLWVRTPDPARLHAERLLSEGIRVMPGDIYGAEWANHLRISLMRPGADDFEAAMEKVCRSVKGDGSSRLIDLF